MLALKQAKLLTLALFMTGFGADDPHHALSFHNLAIATNFLDGGSYFHDDISPAPAGKRRPPELY